MQIPFTDRQHAGRMLARRLEHLRGRTDLLVLGLPRGGVPVAFEVARHLNAVLDVVLVRKLGVPGHEELAMGAIAADGRQVLNHRLIDSSHIRDDDIRQAVRREAQRIRDQETLYRTGRTAPVIRHRLVVLVDDGVATGSTMLAAIAAVRVAQPAGMVVAVPVGATRTRARLLAEDNVDEVVFAHEPAVFHAVGHWFQEFSPTTDDEVRQLLLQAAAAVGGAGRAGP